MLEEARNPFDVLCVLLAQRIGRSQIEVVEQPVFGLQVAREAVVTSRISRRHQIPQRVVLDVGSVQKHVRVPAATLRLLDEVSAQLAALLTQGDGQRQIGWPETQTQN